MTPPSTPTHSDQEHIFDQEDASISMPASPDFLNIHPLSRYGENGYNISVRSPEDATSPRKRTSVFFVGDSLTPSSKRTRRDPLQFSMGIANLTDTPTTTMFPSSSKTPPKNERPQFWCAFCNKHIKNTLVKHIRGHLREICPTILYAEALKASNSGDQVDIERLLVGCGYCGRTGTMKRYDGKAFLGTTLLATHILHGHGSLFICPSWDVNKEMNNVLTSNIFRDDYEIQCGLGYFNPHSIRRVWEGDSKTEKALYELAKLGGSLPDTDQAVSSSKKESRRLLIKAALHIACTRVDSSPQDSQDTMETATAYVHDLQSDSQPVPISSNVGRNFYPMEGMDTAEWTSTFANFQV